MHSTVDKHAQYKLAKFTKYRTFKQTGIYRTGEKVLEIQDILVALL